MTKAWVISIEPTDKSAEKRVVETLSNRKKIAQVEQHLCELYRQLVTNDKMNLNECITRKSGLLTALEKPPYTISAELVDTAA